MTQRRVWMVAGIVAGSVAGLAGGLAGVPRVAAAQSLADVARAERARREIAPKASKVYTNADLQPVPEAVAPAPSPAPDSSSALPAGGDAGGDTGTATAESAAAPAAESEPAHDEAFWRTRMAGARERLQRSTLFAEALQSRINALTTDFVNRDDPAQRAVVAGERQTALAELTRVQAEVRDLTKAVADIEEEARRAGVPPGWLR